MASIHASRTEAKRLLRTAHVSEPPVPIERLAHQLGAQVRYEPFDGEISGLLFRDGGQTIIGVNALHPKTRQRFTIAHELGHLLLHSDDSLHIDRDFRVRHRDARSSLATDLDEMMANAFAAEVLMPVEMIKRDLRMQVIDFEDDDLIRRLANRYRVSLQTITFRLANLGYSPQPQTTDNG